jgi:hypothetical protein
MQFRRGLKTGLPGTALPGQPLLTSDTHELYIGNEDTSITALQIDVSNVIGGGGGSSFLYVQGVPSATWVIVHDLNAYPTIVVIDSSGAQVFGGVSYDTMNQVTLTFSGGFSGIASLMS